MKTLNIIGCGKVGKTLGHLFLQKKFFKIQYILNRNYVNSKEAQLFLGEGNAISSFEELLPADVYMLSASDDALKIVVQQLAQKHILCHGDLVFHCSGALNADVLSPLKEQGAKVASLHIIRSVSDPQAVISSFQNTVCSLEGDEDACAILSTILQQLGAIILHLSSEKKLVYHAAMVLSSNYSVALIETSIHLLQKIGIDRQKAMILLKPLVEGTQQQVFSKGTHLALTGPIARGDIDLVEQQLQTLDQCDKSIAGLYRMLGRFTLNLAEDRLSKESVDKLHQILKDNT